MSSAGQQLIAGRIPGERIATVEQTADSATFTTTETVIMSITAPLVTGRTYRVRFVGIIASDAAGANDVQCTMRQDSISGAVMTQTFMTVASSGFGWQAYLEVEFTATVTGNKTVVVTGDRTSGTQTMRLEAAAERPSYLYVDYIRG